MRFAFLFSLFHSRVSRFPGRLSFSCTTRVIISLFPLFFFFLSRTFFFWLCMRALPQTYLPASEDPGFFLHRRPFPFKDLFPLSRPFFYSQKQAVPYSFPSLFPPRPEVRRSHFLNLNPFLPAICFSCDAARHLRPF